MLLGLVPILGGPSQPLHWAMSAGIVGVGALLALRHRAHGREAALAPLVPASARPAGRTLLMICAIVAVMITGIVVSRLRSGGELSWLSLAMPLTGLFWFASLGLKALRAGAATPEARPAPESASGTVRSRAAGRNPSRSSQPPRPQVSA